MSSLTAEEMANVETIDAFITAWNAKDSAKAMTFFADDFRFTAGNIGKTPDFSQPDFVAIINNAVSVHMAITPDTTWARGPVVCHERIDDIQFIDGTSIKGKYIAVFTLRAGKIVDHLDFEF
ncbi:MAG: nuclear transport factor 2 family protein [Alphaproteobacteria bacterium]